MGEFNEIKFWKILQVEFQGPPAALIRGGKLIYYKISHINFIIKSSSLRYAEKREKGRRIEDPHPLSYLMKLNF